MAKQAAQKERDPQRKVCQEGAGTFEKTLPLRSSGRERACPFPALALPPTSQQPSSTSHCLNVVAFRSQSLSVTGEGRAESEFESKQLMSSADLLLLIGNHTQ